MNTETNIITLPNESDACSSCKTANMPCFEKTRPCLNCVSFGKPDTCADIQPHTKSRTEKKGSRPHVSSACINCKVAHLACDVSRPCKRCVGLNKTDSCQDVLHKKRGRPKRRDKDTYGNSEFTYDIFYGTIETPAIAPASKRQKEMQPVSRTKPIAFVHETFQAKPNLPPENLNTLIPETIGEKDVVGGSQLLNDFLIDFLDTDLLSDRTLQEEITLILSMELCCAKVPTEIYASWGYHPQELAHRSLYDFVSVKDRDRLSQLHRQLLDHTAKTTYQNKPLPSGERSTSPLFSSTEMVKLKGMANGSLPHSDTIHIKMSLSEYRPYELVLYIGSGLGADLYHPNTLDKQYIVANFQKVPIATSPVTPTLDLPADDWFTHSLLSNTFGCQTKRTPSLPKFNVAPITKNFKASRPSIFQRSWPQFSHPTLEYFSRTSSSALNAAASAVKSRSVFSQSGSSHREVPEKNMEMSIRSLLT